EIVPRILGPISYVEAPSRFAGHDVKRPFQNCVLIFRYFDEKRRSFVSIRFARKPSRNGPFERSPNSISSKEKVFSELILPISFCLCNSLLDYERRKHPDREIYFRPVCEKSKIKR
ncbi:hypothetical protein CH375_08800, partial [Leptospira ellisii]